MKTSPIGLGLSFLLSATPLSLPAAAQESVGANIDIAGGRLHAAPRDGDGVLAFKNIPYAAPPVGNLRWHAPMPVPAWQGERDASQFGNRCLSAYENDPEPGPPRSEDCLTLNIWTTASRIDEKRPVMVWFHGGGFQFGSTSNPQINGSKLAQKGAIIVSMNYRLGVMGYLAHPDLDREGPSGNYGLQDQLAALRWVKANIAKFGGDPTNVTVFGESAGAHAIGLLMTSSLAKGLFHKAIGQSGAFWDGKNGPLESFEEAHARGEAFSQRLGAKSIAELRALPAKDVNAAALWNFKLNPMVTVFSPNVDRYVLPAVPGKRFALGQQMNIPLLAGWNQNEGYPFDALGLRHGSAGEFQAAMGDIFGKERLAEALKLYPAGSDAEANVSANALAGDIVIGEQTWQWLELQKRKGQKAVYGYKFTYTSPYTPIAAHITDVPFVFGTLTPQFIIGRGAQPSDADRSFSNNIMSYWVNFAAKGDPNGPGLPEWPRYGKAGTLQELGTTILTIPNPQADEFRFIGSFRKEGVLPARWRDIP